MDMFGFVPPSFKYQMEVGATLFQISPEEPAKVYETAGTPSAFTMDQAGSKLLRGLLEVFLLESLEREPKHGYAILKEMADAFGVEPNRNRLYPLLGKLVKEGWVREVNDAQAGRTIYALSEEGHLQLEAYRRLPRPFRDTLGRVWTGAMPPQPALAPAPAPPKEAPATAPAPPAPAARPVPVPVNTAPPRETSAPAGTQLPYPCAEARITVGKDPRTGDLNVQVTGCPMGAYEYCPKCPVFHSVEGVRRAVFSL